jgi:carbonic anhydrase
MPESLSRRMFLRRAGAVAGVGLAGALAPMDAAGAADEIEAAAPTTPQIGSRAALRLLMEGNRRWVRGRARHPHQSVQRRRRRAGAQSPFAVVYS